MVTKAKKALLASLAAFLCVMLTVFGLSMSVSLSETAKAADETTTEVAEVNGVKFATLAEAIAAAKDGETVTLHADTTEDVVVDKNITLDLGGKTLTGTNSGHATVSIQNGATTTVKNGSIVGSNSYYTIEIIKFSNATATFENLTATAGNTGSSMIDNWGTLTINSGVYFGGLNVVKSEEDSKLTINGGKFTLAHSEDGYTGVILVYGDTTINGGEFIQSLTSCGRWDHPQVIATGVVEGYTATTKVTGGSFTNLCSGEGIFRGIGKATSDNFEVSGGTFNKSVPDSYFADGFIPTQNADGTFGVKAAYVAEVNGVKYKTLQEAIGAASRNAIVTLLADTRENVTITQMYITLDLNGHTINGGTVNGKPAVTVTARVTIKDSSEAQTGTIMREDTEANSGVSSHYVIDVQDGWLTFEGGKVINNSGNVEGKGASLVRVGDDSVAKYPGLNIKGGTFTQDNFIVIKVDCGDLFLNGGTLNSTNSYAIENWHRATVKGGTVNGDVAAWTYSGGLNSTLTISGGTVIGNVESVSYDGAAGKLAKVSITGGTVTGTLSHVVCDQSGEADKAKATIEVSGGTFTNAVPADYCAEGFIPTQNGDGTFGVEKTEKVYLAKVGETSYCTMDEAFHAAVATGGTLVLLRDYTTSSVQNSGSNSFTIDLNGHTWTYTGTDMNDAAFEINYPNVTLTVKNGKIISNTLVGLIPSAMGGTIKYDNAGLVFDGVTMTSNGGSGIETNGNNTNDSVTLKNSTLNVPKGFGIYFPSSGTLTIDNSTITAKTMGVQVCSGKLNINAGSAITVEGDAVPKAENDGAIQDGAAISIVNRPGYKGLSNIVITGGTFTAKGENKALKAYNWANLTESAFTLAEKVAVSGGAFTSAVPAEYCAEGFIPTKNADGTFGVKVGTYVAKIGDNGYETLQEAFDAAKTGDTVKLLADITLTAQVNITKALNGLTLDGNGKTITCATTTDVFASGGSALYFGNATDKLYCTGIKIKDLTMTGKARFAIFLCGGTTTEFTNVNISGDYYIAVNLYGTHGATMTNCNISNSTTGTDKYISGVWSNVASANPLRLVNTKVDVITINAYTTANTLAPKIFIDKDSFAEVHTFDDGSVSGDKTLCVSKTSEGTYTVKEYDATNTEWVEVAVYVAEVNGAKYTTLQAAIDAATSGATVTLLSYVEENVTIANDITLDLNGFTLNGGTGTAKAAITNHGTLTITDSSAKKTGTIKRDDSGIVGETSYYVIRNLGTMTIEQANVINNSGSKGSSLIDNIGDEKKASLTIKNGHFEQQNFIAIKNDSFAELTVIGGEIVSKQSAIQNWCDATITGGKITGQIWTDAWQESSIGKTVIDGTVEFTGEIVMDVSNDSIKPELTINGGNLSVTNWRITTACAKLGGKPAISGGTFSSEVNKDYLAKGYRLTKTGDSYSAIEKYIASSTVSLGVDLSFKYEMVKGKSVDRVVASYYKVNETEATEYELTNVTIDGVVYYVFNGITPQMIDRKISVNVYVGNTVIYDVVEYSILDNLGAVLKKELGSKQDVTRQLVASLAYYGKAAMEYVKYDSSAVQKFIDDNKLTQLTAEIKDGVVAEYNSNETKVARISVQFADTNKVLVGVDEKVFDNYNYTIMVNGQEIKSIDWQTGVVSGYNVYVSEGFAARYITDASKYVEVEVLDKNNNNNRVQYVKYNVAGYCMMMKDNATMGALATATYYYGVAAANYAA